MAKALPYPVTSKPQVRKTKGRINPWPTLRFITTAVFLTLIGFGWVNGSTSSLTIGPLTIACPLGVVQVLAASGVWLPALALAGGLGLLLIVFFGRFFCGWVCPGRFLFNRKPSGKPLSNRTRDLLRGGILGGTVALSAVCHNPLFCLICPAGVVCRGAIAAGTDGSLLPTVGWLGMVAGLEQVTRRSWCRDLCPLGFMNQLVSRLNPFFKVQTSDQCVPCKACENACPEGIKPTMARQDPRCTKCMECMYVCPRSAVVIKLIDVEGFKA
jgi:ferredoxin-type protein NapH